MKRLNNELLKKEFKKLNRNLVIAIVLLILGIISIGFGMYAEEKKPQNTQYLNDIIESENTAKENIKVNVKVSMKPYQIAKMTNSNEKYYIIADDNYFYIASLTDSLYNDLISKDLTKEPITIYGTTKTITSDIKELAKKAYNNSVNEEQQITNEEEFYNIFGDVYLMTTTNIEATILLVIGSICLLSWFSVFIIYVITKIRLERTFKKIDDEELRKIEEEIDDKEAFHYERAHLILTKNYIISFLSGFKALKYTDIIWLYEHRLRQYGMTTQKSIMVMDKTGKVKPIITLDGLTRKSKIVFDEITETILSKNKQILVGYNKENRQKIKEEYNFK